MKMNYIFYYIRYGYGGFYRQQCELTGDYKIIYDDRNKSACIEITIPIVHSDKLEDIFKKNKPSMERRKLFVPMDDVACIASAV